MKKLGIIGGAGPLASALFYETIVQECYRLQRPLPEMVLLNYPFTRGLNAEEKEKNSSILRQELQHCLNTLEAGGVSVAILVCNTLHLELVKIPHGSVQCSFISELVLGEIRQKKSQRLLLLGTPNTCSSSLYQQNGITIICPSPEDQNIVSGVIDHILEGKILPGDAHLLEQLINDFPIRLDGVILGCTDLPVLHHHYPLQVNVPLYDSVKIPAKTILRYL